MLHTASQVFNNLKEKILTIPAIDCHEHLRGPDRDLVNAPLDPIFRLVSGYLLSDLWTISNDSEIAALQDERSTADQRWEIFSRLWAKIEHTAYAQVTKIMLRQTFGIKQLSRENFLDLAAQIKDFGPVEYFKALSGAGIKAVITDVLLSPPWEDTLRFYRNPVLRDFLEGRFPFPQYWYPVFNANYFHELRRIDYINFTGNLAKISISSLADYEQAVYTIIQQSKQGGIIAIKDWSAYHREINFELTPRSKAERLINRVLADPRNQLSYPDAKPLDDYLFHQIIRCAQGLNLPVQVHTGHMAGIRQQVDKANAKNFISVLELYPNVRFDLFHANWPYLEDILFIGKNYPNVAIDLCWASMIDPIYCIELLKRCVLTIPHVKIHGFGGDYFLTPEMSAAQLCLTREVITSALADLVELGWLEEKSAIGIAADWLYNNPNRFYSLGLPEWNG